MCSLSSPCVLCAGAALVAGKWADQWLFWVGPISGAIIAALAYELVFNFESKAEQTDLVSGNPNLREDPASKGKLVAGLSFFIHRKVISTVICMECHTTLLLEAIHAAAHNPFAKVTEGNACSERFASHEGV
jgi:Major intrinsic protein